VSIAPIFAASILIALAVGGLLGWLAARPALARLQAESALHATFQTLSAKRSIRTTGLS